jgi:hypothetical protein
MMASTLVLIKARDQNARTHVRLAFGSHLRYLFSIPGAVRVDHGVYGGNIIVGTRARESDAEKPTRIAAMRERSGCTSRHE